MLPSFRPATPPLSPYNEYSLFQFEPPILNLQLIPSRPNALRRFLSADSGHPLLHRLLSSETLRGSDIPVPNLELHSAAASGNVGLVHYALTHGQPVNSVLHGVLPLHAACSGGSVSVVRMLIERGADVNAPRLPRRYSDNKKSTAPSVGTSGKLVQKIAELISRLNTPSFCCC